MKKDLEMITKWLRDSSLVVNEAKTKLCLLNRGETQIITLEFRLKFRRHRISRQLTEKANYRLNKNNFLNYELGLKIWNGYNIWNHLTIKY